MANNKNKQKKKACPQPKPKNKGSNLEARIRKLENQANNCCAVVISPDTKAYIHALSHLKWNSKYDRIPTVPDTNNLPTYRQVVKAVGNGAVGVNGVGFVKIKPLSTIQNSTSTGSVQFTDGTSPLTTLGGYNTYSQSANSDSTINYGALTPPTSGRTPVFRTVACTLSVRNKDPSLTRAGTVYLFSSLDNFDTSNMSANDLLRMPSTKIDDFSSAAEHKTFWFPQQERDVQFQEQSALDNALTDPTAIGALIVAEPGTKFYFEMAAIVEISGENYRPVSLPATSDISGYNMVKDYLGQNVSNVLDMAKTSAMNNARNIAYEASIALTRIGIQTTMHALRQQRARATMTNTQPLPFQTLSIEDMH